MLILLPPSEGKSNASGEGRFDQVSPDLAPEAGKVFRHIDRLKVVERAKFYGQKDPTKAKAVHAGNAAALRGETLKAIERYTGVVYQHIDYPTLRRKRDVEKRIHVVSAYFGLIGGDARIPNYKMPINTWLAKHWLAINAERLAVAAKRKPVLSLLSLSYAKAIPDAGFVHIDFRVSGGKKAAGHFGKAIKGRFVRWLIEERVSKVADFGDFREDGYAFDGTNFVQP